jgi:hypothetical protein
MGEVIQLTEEILGGDASNSYKFYAWLASKWIYNRPLAAIIEERIAFLENQGSNDSASKVIRNLLKDLDQKIRYRIVKHYLAYCDILDLALRMRGLNEEADAIEPFHVYLECGASDRILLSLMSIGLSRTTAIFLKPLISLPQDATPEDCLSVLSNMSFTNLPLPRLCVKEIRRLVG